MRVLSALMVGALVLGAPAAVVRGAATIFTVTKTADTADGTCDADCSLREAITAANANAGTDTIAFAIPGAGPHTISPTSALPTITDPVIIDGYTQTGASTNTNGPGLGLNTVLKIELNGISAGAVVAGLRVTAGGSTIRGLAINRFSDRGVVLQTNGVNVVEGNFIGTNVAGTSALGNLSGLIVQSSSNTIGGSLPAARNLISGNDFHGVSLQGTISGNSILGNLIGTDASGSGDLGNGASGISIDEPTGTTIGGTDTADRNVISGNDEQGIQLFGGASGTSILGNYIGTDRSGTADLGNTIHGVLLFTSASTNTIGGSSPGAGNLISGNDSSGVSLSGAGVTFNTVAGNLIGVNAAGTAALGNARHGVRIGAGASDNTVGGLTAEAGNVISGNTRTGVRLRDAGTSGNVVQGNLIGTDVSGTLDIGNVRYGVRIGEDADDNLVGGILAGAGNVIAFNGFDGVSIKDASTTSDAILGNSIFSNVELGIDLTNDHLVAANDAGDGDTGANNLQNFPVLTSAVTGGGFGVTVVGTLDSAANTVFRVEFFSNAACDSSGNGEGETFLGSETATTDGSGTAVFAVGLTKAVLPGEFITATATDPDNNTSEFSACRTATIGPPVPVPGLSGPWLAGLATLLAGAFAWTVRRRHRAIAV